MAAAPGVAPVVEVEPEVDELSKAVDDIAKDMADETPGDAADDISELGSVGGGSSDSTGSDGDDDDEVASDDEDEDDDDGTASDEDEDDNAKKLIPSGVASDDDSSSDGSSDDEEEDDPKPDAAPARASSSDALSVMTELFEGDLVLELLRDMGSFHDANGREYAVYALKPGVPVDVLKRAASTLGSPPDMLCGGMLSDARLDATHKTFKAAVLAVPKVVSEAKLVAMAVLSGRGKIYNLDFGLALDHGQPFMTIVALIAAQDGAGGMQTFAKPMDSGRMYRFWFWPKAKCSASVKEDLMSKLRRMSEARTAAATEDGDDEAGAADVATDDGADGADGAESLAESVASDMSGLRLDNPDFEDGITRYKMQYCWT